MASPKVINYYNNEKLWNEEKIQQALSLKEDTIVPDVVVQESVNVVTNNAVKQYVDAETARAAGVEGKLEDLDTATKTNLVAAINEVKASGFTVEPTVSDTSANPVASTGVKAYVDDQDTATLQSARDYTDSKIGTFETSDGSTVVELTGHLGDLKNAAESLVQAINNTDERTAHLEGGSTVLASVIDQEKLDRQTGDEALDVKITSVEQAKQDKLTFDDAPTLGSDNPVKSQGIKNYVDEITGELEDLDVPSESLVSAINQLGNKFKEPDDEMSDTSENAVQNKVIKAYVDDKDNTPTEDSEKAVTSDGVYKAIRKAGVKIGEIMDWPQFKTEVRAVVSDSPFEFTFNGTSHSVAVSDTEVELEIADNVPEGWAATDGAAVIDADTNPELAQFFGGRNTTTEGKIWIPYLARKIIKVAY